MIILVGSGCLMLGAFIGVVIMGLCVAGHNNSIELENRQKEEKDE